MWMYTYMYRYMCYIYIMKSSHNMKKSYKTMTTIVQMLYMHLLFVFMIGNIDHVVVIEGAVPSPLVDCIAEPSNNNIDSPSYHGASSDGAKKELLIPRTLSRHKYAQIMPPASQTTDLVFFAVNSARGNSILRDVIRRTWGSVALRMGMKVKFFVGHSDDMLGIEVEKAKHGDIIVLNVDESNFREGYNLLSKKTMLLMKWLDTHLKQTSSFAVKIDDDVYFDVEAFIACTYKIKEEEMSDGNSKQLLYYGYINDRSKPIRQETSKWYDPDFKAEVYPPYAAGIFYMLSRSAVHFLSKNSMNFKQWRNEDASVGTWLYGTRTKRLHDGAVYPSRSYRDSKHTPVALHMAMSTNVKSSERKLHVQKKDFDALFTASLMNAAHRHLQEYGTILGVCKDSADEIDAKNEASNVVYMSVDEWILGRM